jgi:hypothetical protein
MEAIFVRPDLQKTPLSDKTWFKKHLQSDDPFMRYVLTFVLHRVKAFPKNVTNQSLLAQMLVMNTKRMFAIKFNSTTSQQHTHSDDSHVLI